MKQTLIREAVVLVWLLLVGIMLLPVMIWFVGDAVFGDYGGDGFGMFFGELIAKLVHGDIVMWFLVLSPYLAIMVLRLMAWGWRSTRGGHAA